MNQIVLAYSPECEAELLQMGFKKQEVYVKWAPGATDKERKQKGEAELFGMRTKPFQFCVSSYWGAGVD